jgi:hypothetical protein
MNISNRLKKMEEILNIDSEFCRCGTPYFASFIIGGENIVNNVCPECRRNVKPKTVAEFVEDAYRYEYEIILPKVESDETKTI